MRRVGFALTSLGVAAALFGLAGSAVSLAIDGPAMARQWHRDFAGAPVDRLLDEPLPPTPEGQRDFESARSHLISGLLTEQLPRSTEGQRAFAEGQLRGVALLRKPIDRKVGVDEALRNYLQQLGLAERAAGALRLYLQRVPDDGYAWLLLAQAERRQNHNAVAALALKASILTAPWLAKQPLPRCLLGIELFSDLDDETRTLLEGQFRVAAQRSPLQLARDTATEQGMKIARAMLASSPDELAAYDAYVGK